MLLTEYELWCFLPWGFALSVALEAPVLLFGLSSRHSWQVRLMAGFWLTACTYPLVALVMPLTLWPSFGYTTYLVVAETFAPLAECGLFWWMVHPPQTPANCAKLTPVAWRDYATIILANQFSFLVGGALLAGWQQ